MSNPTHAAKHDPSPNDRAPNYGALAAHYTRVHRLEHVASIASWDQAAFMPPGGSAARNDAMAEIASLLHELRTDRAMHGRLDDGEGMPV